MGLESIDPEPDDSEIVTAIKALERRKESRFGPQTAWVRADDFRHFTIGLDLDWEEVNEAANHVTKVCIAAILNGSPAPVAIKSFYIDGVITGILLAQLRAERDR